MDDRHPQRGPALSAISPTPLPIAVRRARAADRDAVLRFATHTWDGWDYIPEAWQSWLEAGDGVFLVAEAGAEAQTPAGRIARGQPIAISRIALLAEGEAWLEGIRVDPAVRGRGVATCLQVAELAWARAQGATWLRYATGEENAGSHRLGARHGFGLLGAWRWYARRRDEAGEDAGDAGDAADGPEPAAGPTGTARHQVAPDASAAEVARLWRLVDTDPTFEAGRRLYECRSWAFQPLTEERFAAHLRAGEVHAAPDGGRALAITPRRAGWSEEQRPHVALIAGDGDTARRLMVDLREAFGGTLAMRLPWPDPPLVAGQEQAWATAGFGAWGSHSLHVLGRALPAGAALPAAPPLSLELLEPPRRVAIPSRIGD